MKRELWEINPDTFPYVKEVMPRRKRRITKGRLVEIFKEGGDRMSPTIDTEVRKGADDVAEGVPYEIVNVEDIVTDVRQYSGIRVQLLSKKAEEGTVVLWKRKVTGETSKLGVFILNLGNNTDKWLHKWIIFKTWEDRNRVLEVVPTPAPKAPKAEKS